MNCPECGSPIPASETRCPRCEHPEVGDPRRAPRGSDGRSDEPTAPTGWNAAFWATLAVVLLASLVVVLLG